VKSIFFLFFSSSSDTGWSTIKWENTNAVVQKPTSTINMAGLQFVSAPAVQANNNVNIIHTGRKTNPIIETFKCELCNQVNRESSSPRHIRLQRVLFFPRFLQTSLFYKITFLPFTRLTTGPKRASSIRSPCTASTSTVGSLLKKPLSRVLRKLWPQAMRRVTPPPSIRSW